MSNEVRASMVGRLRRLGTESLIYGLSTIVGRLLSFLLQPYYAHHFDPAQNGIQSVVYSYIPIVSMALYVGMDVAYMRTAAATTESTLDGRRRAFSMTMFAVVALGGSLTAVLLAVAPRLASLVRLDVDALRFLVAISYTDALLTVPFAHLRMTGQSLRYAILRLVFVGISITLNILLIGQLGFGVSAIFAANLIANLVVLLLFAKDIAALFRLEQLRQGNWGPLWTYALPLLPATLAVMLVENGDRLVLNALPDTIAHGLYGMSSKDVVGIYSFNYKLGVAMLLIVQMFRLAWVPFSLQHARQPGAPQLFTRVLTALMLTCAFAFLGISILLPILVQIPFIQHYIKPSYWSGLPIVPVILLGYVFSGMYAVVTAGLYVEHRTRALAWIATAGALANLALCAIAASRWGMVGVAWATPVAYALMAALGAWQANRVFPVPFEWTRLGNLGVVVAGFFGIDRWITAYLAVPPLSVPSIVVKVSLLLAFPIVLLGTRFFRRGELEALRTLFPASGNRVAN